MVSGRLEERPQAYPIDAARNTEGAFVDLGFGVIGEQLGGPSGLRDGMLDVVAGIFQGKA